MGGSVRQKTKIPYGSVTRVTNTYPHKKGIIKNAPPGSVIAFDKDFFRTDLKTRIARLKSTKEFKAGENKIKAEMKRSKKVNLKRGQSLTLRNGNLRIKIKA